MSWKKLIIGEPVPDKDDPRYKEHHERCKAAGEKFARIMGLATLGEFIHRHATPAVFIDIGTCKVAFLALVFGVSIFIFAMNVFRMVHAYNVRTDSKAVAVERVDSAMRHRLNR